MNKSIISAIVDLALLEDIGSGDLTAKLIKNTAKSQAKIISQQEAVICGLDFVDAVYAKLDPEVKIKWLIKDGSLVGASQVLALLSGKTRSLLTGERTALNFLQILSSTATLTRRYSEKIKHTKVKLLDTRKTIPGLRLAQKYAVQCGGGYNHRLGLYDAVLIKENHIAACGSIKKAVAQAQNIYPKKRIEIEVRNLNELQEALKTAVAVIMLDNFKLADIIKAVKINNRKKILEISGGVNLKNIAALAQTGVDYISVGAITKIVMPIELTFLVT